MKKKWRNREKRTYKHIGSWGNTLRSTNVDKVLLHFLSNKGLPSTPHKPIINLNTLSRATKPQKLEDDNTLVGF